MIHTHPESGKKVTLLPIPFLFPFIHQILLLINSKFDYPRLESKNFIRHKVVLNAVIQERLNCRKFHLLRDHIIYLYRFSDVSKFTEFSFAYPKNSWVSRQALANGFQGRIISEELIHLATYSCQDINNYVMRVRSGKYRIKLNSNYLSTVYKPQIRKPKGLNPGEARVFLELEGCLVNNGAYVVHEQKILATTPYDSYNMISFPQATPIGFEDGLLDFKYPRIEVSESLLFVGTSNNWYHFLVEIAPRILKFCELGHQQFKVIVTEDAPPQIKQVCERLTGSVPFEVKFLHSYAIKNLFVCLDNLYHEQVSILRHQEMNIFENRKPDLFALRSALRVNRDQLQETQQRIFLARGTSKRRPIQNFNEIEGILASHNFQTIYLETLSLDEQIRLMATASHLVVEAGAAMTNILFADENCKVLRLEPPEKAEISRFWEHYAEIFGLEFHTVYGNATTSKYQLRESYSIDPDSFRLQLRDFTNTTS